MSGFQIEKNFKSQHNIDIAPPGKGKHLVTLVLQVKDLLSAQGPRQ